ncbi:MAG: FapA family protein [bacterium]
MTRDSATTPQTINRRRAKITISKDRLSAVCALSKPEPGEPPLTMEEVQQEIAKAGVVFNISLEDLAKAIQDRDYSQPIVIAQGIPMVKGTDTQFEYLFETGRQAHSPVVGKDGRIDYRNINYIQNTKKDEVLARMLPPTDGKPGTSVTGEEIAAPRGRTVGFSNGEGTRISEDGSELIAAVDGAIVFKQGHVAVKEVTVVNGDVDFNIGNLDCRGSVKITGHVNAGFTIKVGGNLDIGGNVEDCILDVGGNVVIRGGFFGNGEGRLKAGGDVTIKYAEGQKIECGGNLTVGGELLNCQVTAKEVVRVQGSKGRIVGGEVNAGKEVWAAEIGSDAGTATILRVAYDADLMGRYRQIVSEMERVRSDRERVKDSLCQLYKLQMSGKLNAQQAEGLKKLEEFHNGAPQALESLAKTRAEVEERIRRVKDARVIATNVICPGVNVHIGILTKEFDQELRACLLFQDGFTVQATKYDPDKHGR